MMKKASLFKNGIWIKEQQGQFTVGSLNENDPAIMVIPDALSLKILEFETDMMDALYGEHKKPFHPAVLNLENLFDAIGRHFKKKNLHISFSRSKDIVFKGDYNHIFNLIEKFVSSSLSDASQKETIIYINASVLQGHLCIIYRDSASVSHPSKLREEIDFIKTVLNGEISYKATAGEKFYYDIMIPSKE